MIQRRRDNLEEKGRGSTLPRPPHRNGAGTSSAKTGTAGAEGWRRRWDRRPRRRRRGGGRRAPSGRRRGRIGRSGWGTP